MNPDPATDVCFEPGATESRTPLALHLSVRDPEVVAELARHPDGPVRAEFALSALRVGVLAIRQASGAIDAAAIREEGQRLVAGVGDVLKAQSAEWIGQVSKLVAQYFDPKTGVLETRLSNLLRKDGEFDALLRRHLDADTSTIAQTLARHVGAQSAIFKLLSPDQKEGLLAALSGTLEGALKAQHERLRNEFSLDHESSALSRLVQRITDANGRLRDDLKTNVNALCAEFSLDNEQGALKRLVDQVEGAQRRITREFDLNNSESALKRLSELLTDTQAVIKGKLTLDDEGAPLARMQKHLLDVLRGINDANVRFQAEVREALSAMQARREEIDRSTRHGGIFEEAVGDLLMKLAQQAGDSFDAVGNTTGAIAYCKVGDHLITLGPDSAAPGERIVFEAKEDQSYRDSDALVEIKKACDNRQAQVGVFIYSKRTAPPHSEPLRRDGSYLFVIWDQEDPASDIYLKAAVSVARMLVVRKTMVSRETQEELATMEQAVFRIGAQAKRISDLQAPAETARRSSQKILDELTIIHDELEKQVRRLQDCVQALRPAADSDSAAA